MDHPPPSNKIGSGGDPGDTRLRVQFDPRHLPAAAWWAADYVDGRQMAEPLEGTKWRLTWTDYEYMEHTFPQAGVPQHKMALVWRWRT